MEQNFLIKKNKLISNYENVNTNNTYINSPISFIHSFFIGTLTLTIVGFILNPDIFLNSITVFISLFLNL